MSTVEQHEVRKVIPLEGFWDFAVLGEEQSIENLDVKSVDFDQFINVPGCWDMLLDNLGKRAGVLYRKKVTIPANQKALIFCGGLSIWGKVFVDGVEIADHRKPYSSFWCEVPASDKSEREVIFYVDNRFDYEKCQLVQPYHDYYYYGGIFREVSVHLVPESFIKNVKIDATDYENGNVEITVFFGGNVPEEAIVSFAFDDSAALEVSGKVVDGKLKFSATVSDFKTWSPESPNLHTLLIVFGDDDWKTPFGIRKIETRGTKILLNGQQIKLLGFNRHEAHPNYGNAVPIQQQIIDLQHLKNMGCNFVRGSHYPQDDAFLDLCDKMGFLVWEESVGWGQKVEHFLDPKYRQLNIEQTREMIESHWNHPSIIIWGFQNESESFCEEAELLYPDLIETCKNADSTRLVVAATNRDVQCRFLDRVDVICFNLYPGWYPPVDDFRVDRSDEIVPHLREKVAALKELGRNDRPLIVSEIGAGAVYGFRDQLAGMWTEEYQAQYLSEVCREVVENDEIAGVGLWQFCDCRTYNGFEALKRPRSFNNKGVLDEYRRPKLAYQTVKEIFAKK